MYDKEKAREYYQKIKGRDSERRKAYMKIYRNKNKDSLREYNLSYYEKNKEHLRKNAREYFQNNKTDEKRERHIEYTKTWYSEHREEVRIKALMNNYGLTLEEYEVMLERQENKCSICGSKHTVLCVDHNHETGKVRGLLCHSCNLGLGTFKDNIHLLQKSIDYLKEFGEE